MAKNFFEQLLSKAGEIWSGPTQTHYNQNVYVEGSSGLSGVARYLAKQDEAARVIEEKTKATQATGVEKYLARQQASAPVATAPKTFATGVDKYLSKQAPVDTSKAKQSVAVPKTGVGKYLAGMPLASEAKAAPAAKKPQAQQSNPVAAKAAAAAPVKKPAPTSPAKPVVTAAPKTTPAPVAKPAPEKPAAAKPVAAEASAPVKSTMQCQASTAKGTQCKNTTNLTKIQRTINKKKYQFLACAQHSGDTFKPFASLVS